MPPAVHEDLIVGPETRDDAAVYRLTPEIAIVVTADFITPVVDDPVDFGAIAAANSLSDVYAMGGEPLIALNLVGFPRDALELSVLDEILSAGAAVVHEAGALTVGGHSIDDPELKFGLSVVGRVHPDRVVRNSGGRRGDRLYLTKALGVGIVTTAGKRDAIGLEQLEAAVAQMKRTNRDACGAMLAAGVRGATDVTGFGLVGHLHEMAQASGVSASIRYSQLPLLAGVEELARQGVVPGGTERNLSAARGYLGADEGLAEWQLLVACDAQTSGGLLLAVAQDQAEALEQRLAEAGVLAAAVGELGDGSPGSVRLDR
ncbi:MAG: selenide, water dikinase SelD [Candidatus Dormibacteraeota bacterium]|nr:selenide, water dikinase SelD [Candidatus Dormibacteraeota bacterium]